MGDSTCNNYALQQCLLLQYILHQYLLLLLLHAHKQDQKVGGILGNRFVTFPKMYNYLGVHSFAISAKDGHIFITPSMQQELLEFDPVSKKFIAHENTQKPLSDNKLSALLSEQGINVARRTVAKYRESMSISPSNERKRLA